MAYFGWRPVKFLLVLEPLPDHFYANNQNIYAAYYLSGLCMFFLKHLEQYLVYSKSSVYICKIYIEI